MRDYLLIILVLVTQIIRIRVAPRKLRASRPYVDERRFLLPFFLLLIEYAYEGKAMSVAVRNPLAKARGL